MTDEKADPRVWPHVPPARRASLRAHTLDDVDPICVYGYMYYLLVVQ